MGKLFIAKCLTARNLSHKYQHSLKTLKLHLNCDGPAGICEIINLLQEVAYVHYCSHFYRRCFACDLIESSEMKPSTLRHTLTDRAY